MISQQMISTIRRGIFVDMGYDTTETPSSITSERQITRSQSQHLL